MKNCFSSHFINLIFVHLLECRIVETSIYLVFSI